MLDKIQNPKSIDEVKEGEIGIFKTMAGSGCIIIQERDGVKKILLVKHGEKPLAELKWKFPGGKLLKGLTLKENALRETKEEVGVEAKIINDLPSVVTLWQQVPEAGSEIPQLMILANYLAEINKEPIAGSEIKTMEWFEINHLPADCSPNIKPGIEDHKEIIK